jgi:enoyl-CoA hydratase/carnithine racemase
VVVFHAGTRPERRKPEGQRHMTVAIEKNGPVATVILDRPERRNAVDQATAQQLRAALLAFDAAP